MSLLALVITLIVIGVLLWLVNTWGGQYIDGKILKIINAVVVVAVVLWLLSVFGVFGSIGEVQVPRLR
jgi:hypothetical protein